MGFALPALRRWEGPVIRAIGFVWQGAGLVRASGRALSCGETGSPFQGEEEPGLSGEVQDISGSSRRIREDGPGDFAVASFPAGRLSD